MHNQFLSLSLGGDFGIGFPEQIKLFKKTGFEAFTGHWLEGQEASVRECAKIAREENMLFNMLHAPWGNTADMWNEEEQEGARRGVEILKSFLTLCAELEIPMLVSHVYVGFEKPCIPSGFGLSNYGEVIKRAEELGVKIAFENTEGEAGLAAIFNEFKNKETVGFCWDSGHEMCYNNSEDLLALYGDRLFATHINDNLGVKSFDGRIFWHDDLHLLPYDGIADWDYNARRVAKTGFDGIITFELNKTSKPNRHENDKYSRLSFEEYLSEAYCRACRFAVQVNNAKKNLR